MYGAHAEKSRVQRREVCGSPQRCETSGGRHLQSGYHSCDQIISRWFLLHTVIEARVGGGSPSCTPRGESSASWGRRAFGLCQAHHKGITKHPYEASCVVT